MARTEREIAKVVVEAILTVRVAVAVAVAQGNPPLTDRAHHQAEQILPMQHQAGQILFIMDQARAGQILLML